MFVPPWPASVTQTPGGRRWRESRQALCGVDKASDATEPAECLTPVPKLSDAVKKARGGPRARRSFDVAVGIPVG